MSMMIDEVRAVRSTFSSPTGTGITPTGSAATTSIKLEEVIKDIIRGLRTRVYEYQHSVPKAAQNANEVQELISKMEAFAEDADKLMLFITEGTEELANVVRQLSELERSGFVGVSSQQLQALWNTIEGFYQPVIDIISGEKQDFPSNLLYQIDIKLGNMWKLCQEAKGHLTKANRVISTKITHDYLIGDGQANEGVIGDLLTDEQKERFLENFDD
jgi:hypothetical protein